MMRFHYVIKLIGRLLRNAIIWRSKHDLSFYHEDDGIWYVDFPDWPFAHHNFAMVDGADKLCSYLADGKHTVRVEVIASKALLTLSGYGLLTKTYSNLFYGADYDATMQLISRTSNGAYGYARHAVCAGGDTRSISM